MRALIIAFVVIVGGSLCSSSAQAGFLYVDVFDGTTHLTVVDGSLNDIDPDPDSVIVRSSALLAAFAGKITIGSGASASSNFGSAPVDGVSTLSSQYTLKGVAGATSDFTITAGQTGFTVPGDPKSLNTSGSFTFSNSGVLGAGSFEGSAGTTNGASDVFDSLITANSTSNAANSGSGNGAGAFFSNGNAPYSMQNVLTAHLVSTKNAVVQGQGTTIVTFAGVPEPASIVMLATFCAPLAAGLFRRRGVAR